jgi:hypothetical protein
VHVEERRVADRLSQAGADGEEAARIDAAENG